MNNNIKSIEEAEKQKIELNEKDPTVFCPVIINVCRKDCICFRSASIRENSGDSYRPTTYEVIEPYCGNAMLTGDRYMHGR